MPLQLLGIGLAVVVAILGCCPQPPGPVKLEPTIVPPAFVAVAPGQTRKSAQFLTGRMLTLRVKDAATGLRVPKAAIGIHGPTLAGGVSGSTFDLVFGPLGAATYRIGVAGAGYVTAVQSIEIAPRSPRCEELPKDSPCLTPATQAVISLAPGAGSIAGQVLDTRTQAGIPGVRVHGGDSVAYSGADGNFRLEGLAPGNHALRLRKTGYSALDSADARTGGGAFRVGMDPVGVTVNFANAGGVFGAQAASAVMGGLQEALRAAGATVKEGATGCHPVQVVAAPGPDIAARAAELLDCTRAGNKLVVLGEWGGLGPVKLDSPGYSPEATEALLHAAGLAIEPDLVRSVRHAGRPEWPIGTPVAPWPFGAGEVAVFQAASVFAVWPARPVLRAPGGYRIAAASPQDPVLAAVAPYGDGLIAATGDTSAWTDATTTGAGTDLGYKENRAFVVNLILW